MRDRILKKSPDRMIAGVCAGVAEYLGWRPRQVRAIFVFLTFFGGIAVLAYFILWLAMPGSDTARRGKFNLEDFREQ